MKCLIITANSLTAKATRYILTLNRYIFALPCCIFNVFTVLRSL
jgi:hypothetical protein